MTMSPNPPRVRQEPVRLARTHSVARRQTCAAMTGTMM
jgi:hypothetical protein